MIVRFCLFRKSGDMGNGGCNRCFRGLVNRLFRFRAFFRGDDELSGGKRDFVETGEIFADSVISVCSDVRHDIRDGFFDFARTCRTVVESVQFSRRIGIVP